MHFKTTCSTAGSASFGLNKVGMPVLGTSVLGLLPWVWLEDRP